MFWCFVNKMGTLWKQIISGKYGVKEGGWNTRAVREGYGVGLWKAIRKEGNFLINRIVFSMGIEGRGFERISGVETILRVFLSTLSMPKWFQKSCEWWMFRIRQLRTVVGILVSLDLSMIKRWIWWSGFF